MMSWRTRIAAVLILAIVVTSAPWPAGWIPEALADPPAPLAAATDRTAVGGGQIPNPDQAGVVERAQSRVTTGTFAAKDGPRFTGQVAHQEPFDGATGISLTPTLSVINLGIPATTALEYEFKVFTAAGTQVYPRQGTDPVRQPSSRLAVPGGVLAPETSYRWEVTAVDGAETVYESRENAWWFSTALWVDARPGARVTTPAHGATVTTTTPRVDLGFTRPTNGTVTVGRVVVTDMDTNAEVWASSWSSSTQVAVPAGHLGWFRRYEIRAWAARQGEESTPGLHSSSRIEVTTAVPSDGIELLRDAGPRYQQVSMTTGGFTEDVLDAQVQSVGPPLAIGRSYRSVTTSGASSVGVFGAGWSTWLDMGVRELPTGVVIVRTAGGHEEAFAPNGSGGYVGSQATASVLVSLGSGRWEWTENLQRYEIGAEGIRKITAPNNFVTSVERDQGKIVRLVDDRSGRVLALSWAGDRIAAVEARPSRNVASTVRWQYTYAADRLIEACAPHGRGDQSCTTYIYADTANPSAITQITDPMGAARAKISYGVRGQVREVEDAVGEIRRFERTPIIGGVQPGTAVTIKTVSGVRLVGYRLNDQGQPVQ